MATAKRKPRAKRQLVNAVTSFTVEIDHHFNACGASRIVRVPEHMPEFIAGYCGDAPLLDLLGVPTESGRRYQITVQAHEMPTSRPRPKANPWRNGERA